jgi:O-antigen/teichoic acid export membrane protein
LIARRVAIGSASNLAGKAVALVTWFLLTPFILGQLGPVEYGIWVLVGSLGAYGYLLDLGVAGAVVKYVAEYRARNEWGEAHALVATALRVYLVLGAAVVLLAAGAAVVAPVVLNIPEAEHQATSWAIFFVGLSIGTSLAFMPATSILRGLQRYDLYNLIVTSGTLVTAAATVIVLAAGGGLVGIVAVNVPVTVLTQLASVALVRRVAPELDFSWHGGGRREVRMITRFSSALFAINVSTNLQTKTDELVIAAFLPVAAVTPYALARRLSEFSLVLTDQFVKVHLPLASELDAVRDAVRLRAVCILSLRLTLAVLVPLSLVLIVFAQPILVAWVGEAYAGAAELVVILAVAGLFRGVEWPLATLLQGMARHAPIAALSIVSGVANLGLSIVLVQVLGVAGVAYGTLIPTAIEAMVILPYGLRVMGIGFGAGVRQTLVPPLVPAVPMGLALLGMREWLAPTGIDFLVPAAVGMAIYGGVYALLASTRPEREIMRSLAGTALRRFRGSAGG